MNDFKEMNEEYAKHFAHKPARTCVAVKDLPFGVPVSFPIYILSVQNRPMTWLTTGVQVEIEVVALQ